MKLVDILARELKEWPESFGEYVGQRSDGSLHGYTDNDFVKWIGETPGFTRCANYMFDRVTRAEWQAAVDALGIPKFPGDAVEWDGEGLPPDGMACEGYIYAETADQGRPLNQWVPGVFIGKAYSANGGAIGLLKTEDGRVHAICAFSFFRPIRTPEQIAADEREEAIKDLYYTINFSERREGWPNRLAIRKDDYARAIDAGWRKQEQK